MPRKPEQLLWDSMKSNKKRHGEGFWLVRMENSVGVGAGDVFGVAKDEPDNTNRQFWIELKVVALPKKPDTPVLGKKTVRVSQKNWHKMMHKMGGRSYFLIKVGEELYLISGLYADYLNKSTLQQLAQMRLPPKDWKQIFEFLRGDV